MTKMNKITLFMFLLVILTACNVQEFSSTPYSDGIPTAQTMESSITPTAKPTGVTATPLTPSLMPTFTMTPLPLPIAVETIIDTCILTDTSPIDFTGTLLVRMATEPDNISIITSSNLTLTVLITGTTSASVSPYTGMIAWLTKDNNWNFLSRDGEKYILPYQHPYYFIRQWSPNNKVLLSKIITSKDYYPASDNYYILDPITGEETNHEIKMVDYLADEYFSTLNRVYLPRYDPFFKIVGYAAHDVPVTKESIILWDIENNHEIWRMDGIGWYGYQTPINWQLDGSHAATLISVNDKHFPPEIVEVSRDGDARILTNISHVYSSYQIEGLTWSPNERYVAFIMNKDILDPLYSQFLYVLDIERGIINNYCLSPVGNLTWSPNSNQLAVIQYDPRVIKPSKLIIIDMETAQANIYNDVDGIIGWTP